MVEVLEKVDSGWWYGRVAGSGALGWFPASYVQLASV
jgi:hypothetical protein